MAEDACLISSKWPKRVGQAHAKFRFVSGYNPLLTALNSKAVGWGWDFQVEMEIGLNEPGIDGHSIIDQRGFDHAELILALMAVPSQSM